MNGARPTLPGSHGLATAIPPSGNPSIIIIIIIIIIIHPTHHPHFVTNDRRTIIKKTKKKPHGLTGRGASQFDTTAISGDAGFTNFPAKFLIRL